MRVTNLGAEPLIVSRVAIRGDEDDVRSPPRVSACASSRARHERHAARRAPSQGRSSCRGCPTRTPACRQAFGHVVVTSTDEEAGEVAMGFRAQVPDGARLDRRARALAARRCCRSSSSWSPGVSRLAGRRDDPLVRHVAIGGGRRRAAARALGLPALRARRGRAPTATTASSSSSAAVWVRSHRRRVVPRASTA